eukprot:TRINITY_DN5753_c0_g1_i3.p1 TRINITY_DN5753_c0_g1~~TRINITY_DN5753_c0_g1_i3.p1  ORF type:complete len:149 (-),score=18.84 TRINITY_DN5753_c0_g1_i3:97-543(-)
MCIRDSLYVFSLLSLDDVIYRSPERINCENYTYSSDIWSLGIIIIELAIGKFPYDQRKTYIEMIQEILNSKEPTLPNPELFSPELTDFLSRCLQKDHTKRWSATDLLKHPWFERFRLDEIDLSEWISQLMFEALEKRKAGSQTKMDIE